MSDETSERPAKRGIVRRALWALGIGLGLLFLINLFFPDLDFSMEDRVGLIRIEGVIVDAQSTIGELKRFAENPSVKAIVLRIDSPGGGVVPSQEIHDAVQRLRHKSNKTVIASMGTVAASGGYYIAVATDRIMANSGTLTGSIGVIMEMANVEGLLKKIGVEGVVIKSGRFKDVGSPLRKMSDEEHELLQSVMDDVHHQFIEAVAAGRGLDVTVVQALADGRIITTKGESNMTKAQIIERVSEQVTTLTKRQAEVVVNTIFDCVRDSLKNGDKTEIRGFGSFRLRARRMKEGRNPKTGATVAVP